MMLNIFKKVWIYIQSLIQKVINAASDWERITSSINDTTNQDVVIWGAPLKHRTNDIEVVYCPRSKKYRLKIDTSCWFETKTEELMFLKNLQHKFFCYLEENHPLNTESINYIFWMSNPGELFVAESIEELYVNYSIFIAGYEAMFCQQKGNTYDHQL